MSTLKVPGAQLSYEVEGSGPLLILIPGAAGVGEVFHQVARELSAHHHVVTYDRRGFSRSQLDQLLSLSLEVQTIYALYCFTMRMICYCAVQRSNGLRSPTLSYLFLRETVLLQAFL